MLFLSASIPTTQHSHSRDQAQSTPTLQTQQASGGMWEYLPCVMILALFIIFILVQQKTPFCALHQCPIIKDAPVSDATLQRYCP